MEMEERVKVEMEAEGRVKVEMVMVTDERGTT